MSELNPPSDAWLTEFFSRPRLIAMVGLSGNEQRSAFGVAGRLRALGLRVIPVHPKAETVGGEQGYARLSDLPQRPDVVDVFLRAELLDPVSEEILALKPGLVWLQEGVRRDDLAEAWAAAGIAVVQDQCLGLMAPRLLPKEEG